MNESKKRSASPLVANLLHLSYNMWEEEDIPDATDFPAWRIDRMATSRLRFDEALWEELTQRMADAGFNAVVLDLGDGIRYRSHPEIAVENAWAPERLTAETARLRDLGLELIPKLNFSTGHDAWLKEYSRCVSTPRYYEVCADLIAEVCELTGHPRLFHIGMDEETAENQLHYNYVVIRQNELFWHDLLYLAEKVKSHGARPWIWSDSIWKHQDAFLRHVPTDILQSNWYYGDEFEPPVYSVPANGAYVQAYRVLEEHRYNQVPTCSNWTSDANTGDTVRWCRKNIAPERLTGFLQTPWLPTIAKFRNKHIQAIDLMAAALRNTEISQEPALREA